MKRGTGVEAGCQKALEKPMADLEAEDGGPFFGEGFQMQIVNFSIFGMVGLEMIPCRVRSRFPVPSHPTVEDGRRYR